MTQTPALVKHVKGSRVKYDNHMLKEKQAKQESDIDVQKSVIDKDIKDLKKKIQTMKQTGADLDEKATRKFAKAEVKEDMSILVEGNALKRKSSDIRKAAEKLEQSTLAELTEKRMKLNK